MSPDPAPDPATDPRPAVRAYSAAGQAAVASASPDPAVGDEVGRTRRAVAELHAELVRNGLVAWTSGNVSARVPGTDLLVIKPSGVAYADLTAETMVVCDLNGTRVSGELSPSSDTASHAYIYRNMPGVGGVVHTHSRYATAWAARGEPIPCVITAMADEFGGDIPVGPFAPIGGEEIGRAVVATLAGHRSPAVLLRHHGVFAVGATPREAVKAAVMCEDAACTVHLATVRGQVAPLPPDQIDALYRRYQAEYGQR
jgi:L-ribulose-5-phosphate 4-epimerase